MSSWFLSLCIASYLSVKVSSNPFTSNRHTGDLGEPGQNLVPTDINGVYLLFNTVSDDVQTEISDTTTESNGSTKRIDPDPLSVVWYLGAFGSLIIFFLLVTFSEWCCASKHLYRSNSQQPPPYSAAQGFNRTPETPPPPYHLFAPPPYTEAADKREPIFIIEVRPQSVPSSHHQ